MINVSRIEECHLTDHNVSTTNKQRVEKYVLIEVKDERNTLDRVLLHFAHFKKETEKKEQTYTVNLCLMSCLNSSGSITLIIEPNDNNRITISVSSDSS